MTLQSTLIKKQLKSIKKPSTTIKNEIKNVSLLLTNTVSNQRHTDEIIETTRSNKINKAKPPRNDNRNIETTKKNGTEGNKYKEKK